MYTTFQGTPLDPDTAAALEAATGALTGRRCRIEHRGHLPIGKSGKYAWLDQFPEPGPHAAERHPTRGRRTHDQPAADPRGRPQNLLGEALYTEDGRGISTTRPARHGSLVERQVTECLRYLYLVSRHHDQLGGLFLPVEQDIDEIWHYLILQTREYRALCEERLPGALLHPPPQHRLQDYQRQSPAAEQAPSKRHCAGSRCTAVTSAPSTRTRCRTGPSCASSTSEMGWHSPRSPGRKPMAAPAYGAVRTERIVRAPTGSGSTSEVRNSRRIMACWSSPRPSAAPEWPRASPSAHCSPRTARLDGPGGSASRAVHRRRRAGRPRHRPALPETGPASRTRSRLRRSPRSAAWAWCGGRRAGTVPLLLFGPSSTARAAPPICSPATRAPTSPRPQNAGGR